MDETRDTGTISRLIFKIREWGRIYFSRILVKERVFTRNSNFFQSSERKWFRSVNFEFFELIASLTVVAAPSRSKKKRREGRQAMNGRAVKLNRSREATRFDPEESIDILRNVSILFIPLFAREKSVGRAKRIRERGSLATTRQKGSVLSFHPSPSGASFLIDFTIFVRS